MDKSTIAIGIAILSVAVAVVKGAPTTETVAASEAKADVAVTKILQVSPEVGPRHCVRACNTILVEEGPQLVWMCDLAYLPDVQDELNKLAGETATAITFTPRSTDHGIVMDPTVTQGDPPRC